MTTILSRGRRIATLAAWAVALASGALVIARTPFTADLSAFLPASPDAGQRVLIEQLKSGTAARTLLVGIDGGDAEGRGAASRALAQAMRASGRFEQVQNGDETAWAAAGAWIVDHRYALSPAVDAARFGAEGLRDAIEGTLSLLGTPAGALAGPLLERDPTGETGRIAESLIPANAPRSEGGVWVSRERERALLLATTRAPGADLDAQSAAIDRVRADFAALGRPELRLVVGGTPALGVASRARIEGEARRLAVAGSLVVGSLLGLAFASMRALVVGLLPVVTGVVAGIAAVGLAFGQVHGMTLGFGATLIGETVDYAIYYLIQARRRTGRPAADRPAATAPGTPTAGNASTAQNSLPATMPTHGSDGAANAFPPSAPAVVSRAEAAPAAGWQRWLRDSWPTVRLGLLTSICGFAALVFSGFPGLAQLGVFSIGGLVAAALATRFVLPVWVPEGAPGRGLRRHLARIAGAVLQAMPRARWGVALLVAGAVAALALRPTPLWSGDLAALSPVPKDTLALDLSLRADLGASDARMLVVARGADAESALRAAEAAGARLDALVDEGALAGYDSPARLLPSLATQSVRRAALPDDATLRGRLDDATAGGPLAASRLAPFLADVAAARTRPPISRETLRGTAIAPLVDALLVENAGAGGWSALIALQAPPGGIDEARVRGALGSGDARARGGGDSASFDPGASAAAAPIEAGASAIRDVQLVDVKGELDRLYAGYLREAFVEAGLGALAVVALLAAHLRSVRRLAAVLLPLALAVLLTLGGFAAAGASLGILHLVGLLLVVAVGSNYALFFDRSDRAATDHPLDRPLAPLPDRLGDAEPAAAAPPTLPFDDDTLASLALANATTVITFGLIALSEIPALSAIGRVVAPGALLALLLSAVFMRRGGSPRPPAPVPEPAVGDSPR